MIFLFFSFVVVILFALPGVSSAMTEIDADLVRDFIVSRGGKVKNNELVSHFKNFLNDPRTKGINLEISLTRTFSVIECIWATLY